MKRKIKNKPIFDCPACSKKFVKSDSLMKHLRKKHDYSIIKSVITVNRMIEEL